MRCQLDTISECSTADEVRTALKNLPKGLNEIYERILLRIVGKGDATVARAERILTWLVGSFRPLQLLELGEALMIEPGSKKLNENLRLMRVTDILTICGSLVEEFTDENGLQIVRLSHYTVQVDIRVQLLCTTESFSPIPLGISTAGDVHFRESRALAVPSSGGSCSYEPRIVIVDLLAIRPVRWGVYILG